MKTSSSLKISDFLIKFALLLSSIIIGLLLCELFVRIFIPVRSVGPSFTESDPYYGQKIKKNLNCVRISPEFTMHMTTNSLGFRGPELPSHWKQTILFLGDSFTMGYGVNDTEEFPALIRKALEKKYGKDTFNVINTGMGSNGDGRWLKFLTKNLGVYHPLIVILEFCSNDFDDNIREGLYSLAKDGHLTENNVIPIPHIRKIQSIIDSTPLLQYSYIIGLLRQVYIDSKENILPSTDDVKGNHDKLTYAILKEVLTTLHAANIKTLALNVNSGEYALGIRGQFRNKNIHKIFQEFNVPLIDVPSKNESPNLYFKIDGHWNASGNAFVAKKILSLPLIAPTQTNQYPKIYWKSTIKTAGRQDK